MSVWPERYERVVLPVVDSTLDEAARRAKDVAVPTWLLALEQTAARGRRGRAWSAPAGNFSATLLLPLNEAPGTAALRSFVMSLAVVRTCVAVTGHSGFALKWPNDVLLNGGKLAGILLESAGQGQGLQHLAIGVGVNLVATPGASEIEDGALRPVSLSGETGVRVAQEGFLDVLAAEYAPLEAQFGTYGFAPIRTAWLAQAARRGEVVTARMARDEITGTFHDVDEAGHLILRTAKGDVAIAAADVFFGLGG